MAGLRHVLCVALLLAAQFVSARGLELRLSAVRADPTGQFTIEGFTVEADGLISKGYGALGSVLWRFGEHLAAGLGFGYYKTGGGDLFDLFGAEAKLGVAPLHALVQGRLARGRVAVTLDGGLGYTHGWLDARGVLPGGFDLDTLDRSEGNVSVLLGAGLDLSVARNLGLVAGVTYHQTFTTFDISDNAVKFLLLTAGIRISGRRS